MNEVKNQVTQEEFYQAMSLVATKEQVESLINKIERRMGNIEARMMTKEDRDEILNLLHKALKNYADWQIEKPIHAHDHRDMHDTLTSHGKRIASLEVGRH